MNGCDLLPIRVTRPWVVCTGHDWSRGNRWQRDLASGGGVCEGGGGGGAEHTGKVAWPRTVVRLQAESCTNYFNFVTISSVASGFAR